MGESGQMKLSNARSLAFSCVPWAVFCGVWLWFTWSSPLFTLPIAAIILIFLFTNTWTIIRVDRSGSKLKVSIRKLTGSSVCEYPLASITKVGFTKVHRGEGRGGRWVPVISFFTEQNGELAFENVVTNPENARQVAEFIGVPYEYVEPPSLSGVMHIITDAISSTLKQPSGEPPENKSKNAGN